MNILNSERSVWWQCVCVQSRVCAHGVCDDGYTHVGRRPDKKELRDGAQRACCAKALTKVVPRLARSAMWGVLTSPPAESVSGTSPRLFRRSSAMMRSTLGLLGVDAATAAARSSRDRRGRTPHMLLLLLLLLPLGHHCNGYIHLQVHAMKEEQKEVTHLELPRTEHSRGEAAAGSASHPRTHARTGPPARPPRRGG